MRWTKREEAEKFIITYLLPLIIITVSGSPKQSKPLDWYRFYQFARRWFGRLTTSQVIYFVILINKWEKSNWASNRISDEGVEGAAGVRGDNEISIAGFTIQNHSENMVKQTPHEAVLMVYPIPKIRSSRNGEWTSMMLMILLYL